MSELNVIVLYSYINFNHNKNIQEDDETIPLIIKKNANLDENVNNCLSGFKESSSSAIS